MDAGPIFGGQPLPSKRYVVTSPGILANLKLTNVTLPPPTGSEVRILARSIGLNFADVYTVLGLYGSPPSPSNPVTPGYEVAGVIDALGPSAPTSLTLGQHVFGIARSGAYATAIILPAAVVFPIPQNWSFSHAAAFPVQTITAYAAVTSLGRIPTPPTDVLTLTSAAQSVLIHSAAGGVGLRALEIVTRAGGTPVCVVGSERKAAFLAEKRGVPRERIIVRGVDEASAAQFCSVATERALGSKDARYDVVIDSVCGRYFGAGWSVLANSGRYVVFGAAALMPAGGLALRSFAGLWNLITLGCAFLRMPKLSVVGSAVTSKTLAFFNLGQVAKDGGEDVMRRLVEKALEAGLDAPMVGHEFAIENAVEALTFMQSGESIGKICLVLTPSETPNELN